MRQPKGFEQGLNLVCHLKRTMYGLKQAHRAWCTRLEEELVLLGYHESDADPGLYCYAMTTESSIFWSTLMTCGSLKAPLMHGCTTASYLRLSLPGDANFFVNIKIIRDRTAGILKICQPRMIAKLLPSTACTSEARGDSSLLLLSS
jgi:hypothetical protein